MEIARKSSLVAMFWILFWLGILCFILYFLSSETLNMFSLHLEPLLAKGNKLAPHTKLVFTQISRIINDAKEYLLPFMSGMFGLTGIILWLFVRLSLVSAAKQFKEKTIKPAASPALEKPQPEEPNKKERLQEDRCRALHLLSLLQREGRLIDFLEENLEPYNDEQIGAAVRDIHEKCKQAVQKYINPKSVMDQNEGEEVTVQQGFDPVAIKLTGNVFGNPPFKGILRHKGWRSSKFDMPSLSVKKDPDIIAPAEVEIM
ncbi:DUF2760 domain-containing protein [Candidatus Magnetomoraceae bacterium gMMP-15]